MRRLLTFLPALLILGGLYLSSRYNYLLFHSLAELFSVVIANGIFMMAWNSRRFLKNDYLMLLGIASLFVGMLDLTHTLAYEGMEIFDGHGPNLATQLWIAARFLQSVSLVAAPLLLRREIPTPWLFLLYTLTTIALLLSIFVWRIFPTCYLPGVGLTPFKLASEYGICLLLLVAIGLLLKNRHAFDRQVLSWLIWSMVLTIASELAFTLYVDVYGLLNLVGHYLKIIAFFLIYKAIIETGLAQPFSLLFRELKQNEAALLDAKNKLATANENLERLVRERTAKLRETIAELERYSYSIAHDMRAPLRAMRMYSQFLVNDYAPTLAPQAREFCHRIAEAGNRLDLLIRDVLSYSRVAKAEPKPEPVDLDNLVRQIIEQYPGMQPPQANIQVLTPLLPVQGNLALLTQCVSSLLANAIKFVALGGPPEVRVWTELVPAHPAFANASQASSSSPKPAKVRLWIEDRGIGIAPEHQQRIWEIFMKVHSRDEYPGTGIGLSIVRKAVERMGGAVGVESKLGQGSRFWIELPAA